MLQGNSKVSCEGRSAAIAPASGRRALLNTPFSNAIRTPVTKSFVPRSPSWNSPPGCNKANAFRAPYHAFTASSTNSVFTCPPTFAPTRRFARRRYCSVRTLPPARRVSHHMNVWWKSPQTASLRFDPDCTTIICLAMKPRRPFRPPPAAPDHRRAFEKTHDDPGQPRASGPRPRGAP